MITDIFLRWIVTGLFVVSALECGYAITKERWAGVHTVGHVLHLVMAVAMAVMAWPRGAALPTVAPMVFFALAALWFAGVALATAGHRIVAGYHAVMMLAMAWMYAVMNGNLLPGQSGHHHTHAAAMSGHAGHHDMASMGTTGMHTTSGSGHPGWIDTLDWLCTIGFAVAAIWWLYRFFAERQKDATRRHFGVACQAMMAAGMAVMFGVML